MGKSKHENSFLISWVHSTYEVLETSKSPEKAECHTDIEHLESSHPDGGSTVWIGLPYKMLEAWPPILWCWDCGMLKRWCLMGRVASSGAWLHRNWFQSQGASTKCIKARMASPVSLNVTSSSDVALSVSLLCCDLVKEPHQSWTEGYAWSWRLTFLTSG